MNLRGNTIINNKEQEQEQAHEVQLISKDDGEWLDYWGGHLHHIPQSFVFPKNQTLLRLWLSWCLTDINKKVCPYKLLHTNEVEHIPRGPKKLYDMRLVMDILIFRIHSLPSLKTKYKKGL